MNIVVPRIAGKMRYKQRETESSITASENRDWANATTKRRKIALRQSNITSPPFLTFAARCENKIDMLWMWSENEINYCLAV